MKEALATTSAHRWPAGGETGLSTAFGTFGELLQGVLPDGPTDFLVTLPIGRWSTATFRLDRDRSDVVVHPPHKQKAATLVRMMLAQHSPGCGGDLTITSSLTEGKGMASSSADLVATARAVGNALRISPLAHEIEGHLRQIEPTDGVLYPGVVAYDHRAVRLRRRLGALPPLRIIGVDEGGTIDTVAFNQIEKPFGPVEQREYAHLLDDLTEAIRARDVQTVGRVATRSAQMNEALRPKRLLSACLGIADDIGAIGVVAAHSGTVLGLLLDPADPDHGTRVAAGIEACSGLTRDVFICHTLTFD